MASGGAPRPRVGAGRPSGTRAGTAASSTSAAATTARRIRCWCEYSSSCRPQTLCRRGRVCGDQMATAATTGRALHGRRAARVQRASHGAQGGHVLRLPARWGHDWPRARAATVAGARFHDRRGAGHPRRPHRGASKHVCARPGPLQGARAARRRAHGVRLDCPRRAVRARAAEDAGLPAGGRYFLQSPQGSMKTRSRTRRSFFASFAHV